MSLISLVYLEIKRNQLDVGIVLPLIKRLSCGYVRPHCQIVDRTRHRTIHRSQEVITIQTSRNESVFMQKYPMLPMKGIRPVEGSMLTIPQQLAGILTLPPMSLPIPIGDILAAIAAASPPELPPGVLFWFQGFSTRPHSSLVLSKTIISCGTLVLTKGIIPEFFMHLIRLQSFSTNRLALQLMPTVVLVPAMSILSLIDIGMPQKGIRCLQGFHYSSKLQLCLPLLALCQSHYLAFLVAYQKQSSVMIQNCLPMVPALNPKMATSTQEVMVRLLSIRTKSEMFIRVIYSTRSVERLAVRMVCQNSGRYLISCSFLFWIVQVLTVEKLLLPISLYKAQIKWQTLLDLLDNSRSKKSSSLFVY